MKTQSVLASLALTSVLVGMSGVAGAAEVVEVHDGHYGRDGYAHDHYVSGVTLGAQFEYGVWTGDGDVNAYGPGVGIRGGFTLDPGIYLGADFDYFAGDKTSVGGPGAAVSARYNVYDIMGEIGYDFWVHPNGILRPKIGLGLGVAKVNGCANVAGLGGCDSRSVNGFAIAPGIQYLHFFSNVFLSLEARYQTVSVDGSDPSAFILGVGLGAGF